MPVRVERDGRVLIVEIQREHKRNAIDPEITAGIDAALNELEDDDDLWVGIITGGPSMFSAGSDLRLTGGEPTPRGGEYGVIRRGHHKPLIAAVEGLALGGGMEIVLSCDLVVASRSATFGLPEIKRGLFALYGGAFRAPRALPLNIAKEIVLTGDPISAERAAAFGFVNVLCENGDALAQAKALAARVVANAPVSVRESLRVVERTVGALDELAWAATKDAARVVWASDDSREGRAAFLDKRDPVWRNR
jgi:enoyl-CoA hydratase/carnithine racemase